MRPEAAKRTEQGKRPEEWKRLALTKKKKITVRIPQRQFLGTSARLEETIRKELENELEAQLIELNIR